MTAVFMVGDVPSTGALGDVSAVRAGSASHVAGDRRALFLEDVERRLHAQGAVLVLYPAWHSGETAKLVQMARGALGTDRVAGIPLRLPPLAVSLIADTLSFLAPYVSPGVLAGMANRLPLEVIAGAWVRSVSGLEHVDVPLKSHLASYFPGGFMVTAAPRPAVHRISGGHEVMDPGMRPVEPILLLVSNGGGDMNWLQHHLAPALRPASIKVVAKQPLSPAFWGTQKYVEFVAFSGHPQALTNSLRSMVSSPCPWCGESSPAPNCPFCGMSKPAPAPPQQTQPSQQQSPSPGDVHVVSANHTQNHHPANGSAQAQQPPVPSQRTSQRTPSADQQASQSPAPPIS